MSVLRGVAGGLMGIFRGRKRLQGVSGGNQGLFRSTGSFQEGNLRCRDSYVTSTYYLRGLSRKSQGRSMGTLAVSGALHEASVGSRHASVV